MVSSSDFLVFLSNQENIDISCQLSNNPKMSGCKQQ